MEIFVHDPNQVMLLSLNLPNIFQFLKNWSTATDNAAVRDNAVDGSIKIVTVTNKGVGLGTASRTYTSVPIKGDGTGAQCTISIDANSQVSSSCSIRSRFWIYFW